jgi:hypothetical protein
MINNHIKNNYFLKYEVKTLRIFKYLFLTFLLSFFKINAQKEMFIEQLSDRLITRENYDKNNKLLNKQTFNVGKEKEINGYYEIDVISEMFNENGESTNKYSTTYRCKPEDFSVMVMAFPFSNPRSKETKFSTTSINFKELYDLDNLEDIEMEISFDSGMLKLFGSKSIIKIYDRVLDTSENMKIIRSKLSVDAYAFGIRLKQLEYTVIEKLTLEGLLYSQKFTEQDGSYFTMTYK